MNLQQEHIRDEQKQLWNASTAAWKKWDGFLMKFLLPMGEEILRRLELSETDVVLDVACGTGEPGLTIASIVTRGCVIGLDNSDAMVEVAREHATEKGFSNYSAVHADASQLPFPDSSFDKISCRFGFMFFPDLAQAAREMARVLKPGGRIATSFWDAPEKNFWMMAMRSVIERYPELPLPPADGPGIFRCAAPGLMTDIFRDAGFDSIRETPIQGKHPYGTKEFYWKNATEMSGTITNALGHADASLRATIRQGVFDLIERSSAGTDCSLSYAAIVISATKE